MRILRRIATMLQRLDEQRIYEDERLRFQLPKGLDCRTPGGVQAGEILQLKLDKLRISALAAYNKKFNSYSELDIDPATHPSYADMTLRLKELYKHTFDENISL